MGVAAPSRRSRASSLLPPSRTYATWARGPLAMRYVFVALIASACSCISATSGETTTVSCAGLGAEGKGGGGCMKG